MKLTTMPSRFIAGDVLEVEFAKAASLYPASDGYTVGLYLTPRSGGTPLLVSATGGVSSWHVLAASTATAALAPGMHRWLLAATKSGNRESIEFGDVEVLPDPTGSTDLRSPAQRALDAIDAMLEGRAGKSQIKFVFEDGRSVEHMPHSELLKLRDHYARRVAAEKRSRRGPARVQVRM